jgi:hypothetical protein
LKTAPEISRCVRHVSKRADFEERVPSSPSLVTTVT